jgi:hypothetical protein
VFPGGFLYLNPYRILCTSNLDDFGCVLPGLVSLPGASSRVARSGTVRDDGELAKRLCQSGFREPSRNFTYLCWVLPKDQPGVRTNPRIERAASLDDGQVDEDDVYLCWAAVIMGSWTERGIKDDV